MSEHQKLNKREANRNQLLKYLYDEVEGRTDKCIKKDDFIYKFSYQNEVSEEELESVFNYLKDAGLLEYIHGLGVYIRHSGINKIESLTKI